MRKLRETWRRDMLRPTVYLTLSRLTLGLFAALVGDHFLSPAAGRSLRGLLFLLMAVLLALLGWVAWLRLDGVTLPKPLMTRFNPRKKPPFGGGDLIDFVDEEPGVTYEDLDESEQDVCALLADAIACAVFLALSALIR